MAQPAAARPSPAISYLTSMTRPDAALALAVIHGLEARRQIRIGATCVSGAGLAAAIYCDIVGRFYAGAVARGSNDVLPIGLDLVTPLPPDPAMVRGVVERRTDKGEAVYPRGIGKTTDTAQAEAVLRNGVAAQRQVAFVLSGPAGPLARALDLPGVKELFTARVTRLVLVETDAPQADVGALRKVLREWPSAVALCGRDVGESLRFPSAAVSQFGWASAHPVADAYREFSAKPYDAPLYDVAAVHYASLPDSGFFQASPGSITVSDGGRLAFTAGAGSAVSIGVVASRRDDLVREVVALATARPRPIP